MNYLRWYVCTKRFLCHVIIRRCIRSAPATAAYLPVPADTALAFKFIDINPLHAQDPSQAVHYKSAEVYVTHAGYADVARLAKTDYENIPEVPVLGSPALSIGNKVTMGDYDA